MRLRLEEAVKSAWEKIIKDSGGLATPREKVRAGFLELALEKTRRANPFVEEGRHLRALSLDAKTPAALWDIEEIRPALLTAAGLSEKAKKHIGEKDRKNAFVQMAREVLEPEGGDFVDELVYRFLLTKGDSLGGKMRNIGGKLAKRKFVNRVCAAIRLRGGKLLADKDSETVERTRFLAWESRAGVRTLALDVSIPQTEKTNVDAVLLSCAPKERGEALQDKANFLALGELKGGIDPAGADEHWKTAMHALERIRAAFADAKSPPGLFFIGAAIERRMSEEIYGRLWSGELAFAANLTNDRQLSVACEWLTGL